MDGAPSCLVLDENQARSFLCAAGISSHVRKGWTDFFLLSPGEMAPGKEKQGQWRHWPTGFARVVVCVLCSFGRGYNQPPKAKKKQKVAAGTPHVRSACTHRHGDMITISRLLFSSFRVGHHQPPDLLAGKKNKSPQTIQ